MAGKINLTSPGAGSCFFILVILLQVNCMNGSSLLSVKELGNYPSGSGIEFFNHHFFLVGDDATHLLKLNSELELVDTINLYNSPENRISKDIKADLEGVTLVKDSGTTSLFLVGSGSAAPYRNTAWLINPSTNQKTEIRLDTFYQRLASNGIEEVNIEGIASTLKEFILVNRGNKTHPKNVLVFTSANFWNDQSNAPVRMLQVGDRSDTSNFNGVSGLVYSNETDRLILTVSTENTYDSYADGSIGKSYLWIIRDLSTKSSLQEVKPDKVIDLQALDKRFEGQKIESACIISESASGIDLLLVADNDNGKTALFKLRLAL